MIMTGELKVALSLSKNKEHKSKRRSDTLHAARC